jgi:hypothetical protein
MRKVITITVALGLCMLPGPLLAAKYDGSVSLVCVPIEIIECVAAGECFNSTAEDVNLPQFIKVDVKAKMLSAAEEGGKKAEIKHLEHTNGRMIMHGGQEGRGWTLVISEETGKMSATISEDQAGFIIFGACTPM